MCEKVQIKGLVQATSEFQTIMSAAGTLASNIFGFKFNEQDPESVVFLEKYVPKFTQQINSITEEDLRAVLTKAQKEGWAVTKIRDEIRAVFNGYTKDRAELIARTELFVHPTWERKWHISRRMSVRWFGSPQKTSGPVQFADH